MDSKNFALEKFAGWEDAFGDGGADCEHWLVHDLAQAEVQGDAAKEISVDVEEAPARDEEIDHAIGGSAGSGDGVGADSTTIQASSSACRGSGGADSISGAEID